MNPELNLFNQRKFCDISSHLQTGPCVWKLENGKFKHFWSKNKFSKTKAPVIYLHLKNVVCFYINSLMQWKNRICLFQCTVVPRIPEFSPDSRLLSFEARMLMLPFVGINFLSKRNGLCWSYKGSTQICRKVFHGSEKGLRFLTKWKLKGRATPPENTLRWSV